jgi:hypothetical protein
MRVLSTPLYRYTSDAVSIMICVNCALRIYIYAFSDPQIRTELIAIARVDALFGTKRAKMGATQENKDEVAEAFMVQHNQAHGNSSIQLECSNDDDDLFELEDVDEAHIMTAAGVAAGAKKRSSSIVARTLASLSHRTTMFDSRDYTHCIEPDIIIPVTLESNGRT